MLDLFRSEHVFHHCYTSHYYLSLILQEVESVLLTHGQQLNSDIVFFESKS